MHQAIMRNHAQVRVSEPLLSRMYQKKKFVTSLSLFNKYLLLLLPSMNDTKGECVSKKHTALNGVRIS